MRWLKWGQNHYDLLVFWLHFKLSCDLGLLSGACLWNPNPLRQMAQQHTLGTGPCLTYIYLTYHHYTNFIINTLTTLYAPSLPLFLSALLSNCIFTQYISQIAAFSLQFSKVGRTKVFISQRPIRARDMGDYIFGSFIASFQPPHP